MEKRGLVFIIVAFSIVISSIVLASHVITPSSFNINEDVSNLFNITVNNSDTLAAANITEVNITLPSSFTFITGTNGTDAGGHAFTNTSTILTWSNSSALVMHLTLNRFWFNATASTPGDYNVTVTTTNSSGSSSSNISVAVNDTTPPTINYTSAYSNGSYVNKTYLIFNITATDYNTIDNLTLRVYNSSQSLINSSSANSTGLPVYLNLSGLSEGTYYFNITVNDSKGNVNNSETRSLLIDTIPPSITLAETADTETSLTVSITIVDAGSGINSACTDSDDDTT
ncbi:MAG TPA: hypothetical protein VI544_00405, partial [Candidatus Nanoarchaeia archaeon]|nr:hypothetical protein [Candidatus Nanoarchaeia archaeon]